VNKKQLIQVVADKMASTQSAAERYVNAFVDGVKKGIMKDGHVQLVGFGAFQMKKRAPRRGRNPQTGELMQIKGGKTVTFRCGKPTKGEL
jgi:DNA-binding protein HU-beta